jgi:beta-ketoacyl-acyl-carrier-protein synthase II
VRRVVVTGLGVISPLGDNADAMFARLMAAESGIRLMSADGPADKHFSIAAPVVFDPAQHFSFQLKIGTLDRVCQFAIAAAATAIRDSGIQTVDGKASRFGVALGTGMGANKSLEDTYIQLLLRDPDRVKPLTVLAVMNNASAGHIAMRYGLGGPNLTYSCACASSAVAIGEALRQIRHGYADVMVAGGSEALLTYSGFKTWEAMRVLALADRNEPSATCRPFSKNRSGLVLGEGAAMVVLEEREAALRRGARIHAELIGYGSSNDPVHITKPTVDGQAQAMRIALADASIDAQRVDYVNAHGTATVLNDVTETRAIKAVFSEHAYKLQVSSTKSMLGHLLGAAGAMEFVISLLAIRHQAVPPTAHLDVPDPDCDLDYVPGPGRYDQNVRCVMSNSFAFGGTNAVLVARQHEA